MKSAVPEDDDFFQKWKTNKLASLKYNRAICMLASGYTPAQVAKHLGVTQRAVQQWFHNSDFNESLRFAIGITLKSALAKAAEFADEGIQILIDIARDKDTPPRYRIDAIKLVFEVLLKANSHTINENLEISHLTDELNLLNHHASIKNLLESQGSNRFLPQPRTPLEKMRTLWQIMYPDKPFPEDEDEFRRWYDDPFKPL